MSFASFALAAAVAFPTTGVVPVVHGNVHDFDFEFGAWKAQVRLREPLSISDRWVILTGTSTVTPFWKGRSNFGVLEVGNAHLHIQGLTLRLYHPRERVWYINFANSKIGDLGTAMIGGFNGGIGTFYDRETYDGKPVMVRFIFSDITRTHFQLVQSFSADGGARWIPNWIARFTR